MKWSKNLFLSFDTHFDIEGTTLCQSVSEDQTSSKEKKHREKLIKQESLFCKSFPRRDENFVGAAEATKKTQMLPLLLVVSTGSYVNTNCNYQDCIYTEE